MDTQVSEELHPATEKLIDDFASALKAKLLISQKKYGWTNEWSRPDWMDECQQHLLNHLAKGDPRDVAAYCAFLWSHGWNTRAMPRTTSGDGELVEALEKAAVIFEEYGRLHRAKLHDGTPTSEWLSAQKKAERNEAYAREMRAALSRVKP